MENPTLEIIAPTVEEALAQGLSQLGLSEEQVTVDVLDAGSKGLFGLGGRQVRIRLTVKAVETTNAPAPATVKTTPAPAEGDDALLAFAAKTVTSLLEGMKIKAKVEAKYATSDEGDTRRAILVDVHGDDLAVLIGRRSETLNSLQYVAGLIVSKEAGHWAQVVIDVEGYRSRRERQLRQIARRMAEQAIRTGKRQILEPMPAGDRRVIHLELREIPEVISESIGEEPARKVTITPR